MRTACVLVVLAACGEEAAVAPPPAAPPSISSAPPPRRNLFVTQTACEPSALCPVDPPFPKVSDIYFENGRPCLHGLDRSGCLETDGWHFRLAPESAPPTGQPSTRFAPACGSAEPGWIVPLDASTQLFWQKNGARALVTPSGCRGLAPIPLEPIAENERWNGIAAKDPNDVWVWTPRFVGHFDGARWERSLMPPACTRDAVDASLVAGDGSIWFVRCEEQGRVLVRFDPRTGGATTTSVTPALGLAQVGGKVAATDFDEEKKAFRQHLFEADGREINVGPIERPFLRAGFDDGSAFVAPSGLFTEVVRVGGGANPTTVAIPTPAKGFYAPSSRELWIGGEKLHRWRDGMMGEVAYRPDVKRAVVELIGGSGPNDVWVASRPAAGGSGPVRLSHWDGTNWRQEDLGADAGKANALAVAGPNDAWLTTNDALYHWNGASWSVANHFAAGRGPSIVLAPSGVFLVGNDTIYRRLR